MIKKKKIATKERVSHMKRIQFKIRDSPLELYKEIESISVINTEYFARIQAQV